MKFELLADLKTELDKRNYPSTIYGGTFSTAAGVQRQVDLIDGPVGRIGFFEEVASTLWLRALWYDRHLDLFLEACDRCAEGTVPSIDCG